MASTISIYAPLSSGLSGQVLYSNGNGKAPTWGNLSDEVGTDVYLNGSTSAAVSAAFYAPLSSGTSGQVLVSRGANISPIWGDLQYRTQQAVKATGVTGTVWCYRYGRVVTVVFDAFKVPSGYSLTDCVTIPEGYRPPQWLIGGVVTTSGTSGGMNISPATGLTRLYGNNDAIYFGAVTYITNNNMPS